LAAWQPRLNPRFRDDIPVIYITVPPAATGKMIATEIARFLGLPVPRRANITDVSSRSAVTEAARCYRSVPPIRGAGSGA
jgi:hypothetical protein